MTLNSSNASSGFSDGSSPLDLARMKDGLETRIILQGYVIPPLTIIVLCIDVYMLTVFYRGRFNTPTHVILIAIAVAEMVNGLSLFIPAVYFFTFGMYKEYVTYNWCSAYTALNTVIPTIAHCISLLLTVVLAIQRLIFIKMPFKAKTLCSRTNTIIAISAVVMYGILFNIPYFYHFKISGKYMKSKTDPSKEIYVCMKYKPEVSSEVKTLLRIIFDKFIPTLSLVIISIFLMIGIRKLSKNLKKLTNTTKISQRNQQNRTLSVMTALVAMSVLVVEVPGIIVSLIISYGDSDLFSCKICVTQTTFLIFHIVILVLYPSNFLIYCFVSEKFRRVAVGLLPCKSSGNAERIKPSASSSSCVSSKI